MGRIPPLSIALAAIALIISLPVAFLSHQWHKLLHILGAILFVGNIVVTFLWMAFAAGSKNPAVAHYGARAVNRADQYFTIPGVILIAVNGLVMAPKWGGGALLGASWVVAALVLFGLSGIVWVALLLPLQSRMVRFSGPESTIDGNLPGDFTTAFRRWMVWGIVATILPLVSLVLMVTKPQLWG